MTAWSKGLVPNQMSAPTFQGPKWLGNLPAYEASYGRWPPSPGATQFAGGEN